MNNPTLTPISSLQQRYGLSSRQAVYDRIAALKIETVARGKLSSEQVDKLDKLHKFLSSNPGAAIADFPREAEVNPIQQVSKPELSSGQLDKPNLSSGQLDKSSEFIELVKEIALAISVKAPQISPAERLADLENIAKNEWLISTAEAKQLLGVKPSGDRFNRGSFTLIRSGKIGGQNAWKIIRAIP